MRQIDLANIPVREANELIRAHGAQGEDIEVLNPDARHHIGVGLIHPVTVQVRGSAGYFCAGLTDGPRFEIDNNVGWGVGRQHARRIGCRERGNAGAIAGVANPRRRNHHSRQPVGSRAGQVMKAGDAGLLPGQRQFHGRIYHVWADASSYLGDSGDRVGAGHDRRRRSIVGGKDCRHWGSDASGDGYLPVRTSWMTSVKFFDRYEISFTGTFQKIVNAGKQLRYSARPEPRVRNDPVLQRLFRCRRLLESEKVLEDIL